MKQYVELITAILQEGRVKTDRTGTGTISTFGHQSKFYMKDGFPLLTMKKTYTKGVIHELLWFLNSMPEKYKKFGNTNIKYLVDHDVHIWDEWAYAKYEKYASNLEEPNYYLHVEDFPTNSMRIMTQKEFVECIKSDDGFAKRWGGLGPIYGKQWVNWGERRHDSISNEFHIGLNQIQNVIDRIKNVPDCRRLMVSAWNVAEISEMALAPCHALFQFITEPLNNQERAQIAKEKGHSYSNGKKANEEWMDDDGIPKFRLSLQLYQRSADTFLGVPFNIASYALLLHMVAQITNTVPYKFVHTFGDLHLYLNHKNQVNEFLRRTIKNEEAPKFDYWKNLIRRGNLKVVGLGDYYGPELPTLKLNPEIKNITDFRIEDIEILDYNPLPAIKAPVAV